MRITQSYLYATFVDRFTKANEDSATALERLTTLKKVQRGSDDPAGARSALLLRSRLVRLDGFDRSGTLAKTDLESIDAVLGEVQKQLSDTRVKAIADATETTGEELAADVDRYRENLLQLGNTVQSGRHLFAGTQTDLRPFDDTGAYAGNDVEATAPLDQSLNVGTTVSGQRVFLDGGDVFQIVEDVAAALRSGDKATLDSLAGQLDSVIDHVSGVRADIGSRLRTIEDAELRHDEERLRSLERISEIEDVSLEQVALELGATSAAYDALAAAAGRVLGRSLFDVLS